MSDEMALDANRTRSDRHSASSGRAQRCVVAGLSLVTRAHGSMSRGGGRVGVSPTSPQLLVGRVALVTDETSDGLIGADRDDLADDDLPDDDLPEDDLPGEGSDFDDLGETVEQAQRAMAEVRSRLAEAPAEVVVTNHVMGLYELAAIHLSATPPDLVQSALAIDAVACLVDGLGDRLGEEAPTMRDALNNIRLAFVQIKGASGAA